ncbi:hypothetical protein PCANC_28529 [Puccinia coronata f. sp. avenae]|uniref:Tet-like 2OG-Fe(II) oxygenase domain-containing protein n=1 Tax=Puccinia coronata f. sp. avenae TaxID=200324 RepID=A0A2N5RUY9_9BASI|nr:hypothetical protein PCANC_28529 [Puccinia coronata f. sp. avenae]
MERNVALPGSSPAPLPINNMNPNNHRHPTKSVEAPPPHASVAASPQPSTGIAKLKPNRPAPSHSQKVQWARAKRRVTAPFAASGSAVSSGPVTRTGDANDSNKDNDADSNADSLSQHNTGSEKEDGVSDKEDKKETLKLYRLLSFGTCIIAPVDRPSFCKVRWLSFDSMSPAKLNGWEKLVCHLLKRCNHISPVKTNGTQTGGTMWADGWRKRSDPNQSVGRFCCVGKMKKAIQRAQYNPISQAAGIQEASDFIAYQLQQLAPGVFESCRQLIINGN